MKAFIRNLLVVLVLVRIFPICSLSNIVAEPWLDTVANSVLDGDSQRKSTNNFRIPGAYIINLDPSHTHDQVEAFINARIAALHRETSSYLVHEGAAAVVRKPKKEPKIIHRYSNIIHGFSIEGLESPDDLKDIPGIIGISPDTTKHLKTVGSWGIDRIDQVSLPLNDSYIPDYSGNGVDIYVVDTGIDTTHIEFQGGSREVKNIYNAFIGNKKMPAANTDGVGHGTHVAGTIGGNTVGIARGANIFGLKVLDDEGSGATSGIIAALDYVVSLVHSSQKPSIVSMSLGGPCEPEDHCSKDQLVVAVENVSKRGIVVSVAAGNEGCNGCSGSPNAAESAINVGATDIHDKSTYFSNYGQCIDIFAPGLDIISACSSLVCVGSTTSYKKLSGTSMACPHVTGVLAQELQKYPTLSPTLIMRKLACNAARMQINFDPRDTISRNLLLNIPRIGDENLQCDLGRGCPSDCSSTGVCQPLKYPNGSISATPFCHCNANTYGSSCGQTIDPNCRPGSTKLDVSMVDDFGDGWTFSSFSIRDSNGFIVDNALDSLCFGDTGTKQYCLMPGTYAFDVTRGYYPSEVSWEFCDSKGGAPFSGQFLVSSGNCVQICPHGSLQDLVLTDSYGDGWNGAYYVIYTESGMQLFGGFLIDGEETTHSVCIPIGTSLFMIFREGELPAEIGVEVGKYVFKRGEVWSFNVDADTLDFTVSNILANDSCHDNFLPFYKFDLANNGWDDISYSFSNPSSGIIAATGSLQSGFTEVDSLCLVDGCYDFDIHSNSTTLASKESFWFACGYRGLVPHHARICFEKEYALCYGINGCPWAKSYEPKASQTRLFLSHFDDDSESNVMDLGKNIHGVIDFCDVADGCYDAIIGAGRSYTSGGKLSTSCSGSSDLPIPSRSKICFATDRATNMTTCSIDSVQTYSCNDDNNIPIFVAKIDSYGDGWGKSVIYTIADATGKEVAHSTLPDGEYGLDKVCLQKGSCYSMTLTSGSHVDEVVWVMCGYIGGAPVANLSFCVTETGCYFDGVDDLSYNHLVDDDFPQPTFFPIADPNIPEQYSLMPSSLSSSGRPTNLPTILSTVSPSTEEDQWYYYPYSNSTTLAPGSEYYYDAEQGVTFPPIPGDQNNDMYSDQYYSSNDDESDSYYTYSDDGATQRPSSSDNSRVAVASATAVLTLKVNCVSLSARNAVASADLEFVNFAIRYLLSDLNLNIWSIDSFVSPPGSFEKIVPFASNFQTYLSIPNIKTERESFQHQKHQKLPNDFVNSLKKMSLLYLDHSKSTIFSSTNQSSSIENIIANALMSNSRRTQTLGIQRAKIDKPIRKTVKQLQQMKVGGIASSGVTNELSVSVHIGLEWSGGVDQSNAVDVKVLLQTIISSAFNSNRLQKAVGNAHDSLHKLERTSVEKISSVAVVEARTSNLVTFHVYPADFKKPINNDYYLIDWNGAGMGGSFEDATQTFQHKSSSYSAGIVAVIVIFVIMIAITSAIILASKCRRSSSPLFLPYNTLMNASGHGLDSPSIHGDSPRSGSGYSLTNIFRKSRANMSFGRRSRQDGEQMETVFFNHGVQGLSTVNPVQLQTWDPDDTAL